MNPLHISAPCSENWLSMTPTNKGAYCQVCSKEVIDFSTKSPDEITDILKKNLSNNLCGRISESQLQGFNDGFYNWQKSRNQHIRIVSFLALLAVFGITLFSCQSNEAKKTILQLQKIAIINHDESAPTSSDEDELSAQLTAPDVMAMVELADDQHIIVYEEQHVDMDDINVVEKHDKVLMGAIAYIQPVREYIEMLPIENPSRYDRNGVLIPQSYGDLVYPNPTYSNARYKLETPEDGVFVIGLYDMNGRHIRNLHEGSLEAGTHDFAFNLLEEQPGTFLLVCRSKHFSNTQRIVKM